MFGKIKEKQLEEEKRYRELKDKDQDELTMSEMVFMGEYDRKRELLTKKERRKAMLKLNSDLKFSYYFYSILQTSFFIITIFITFTSLMFALKFGSFLSACFRAITCFIVAFLFCMFLQIGKENIFRRTEKYLNPYYSSLNSDSSKSEKNDSIVPKINPYLKSTTSDDKIIKMMLGNLDEISEYYRLSKRQAGWAFWSAIVSFFAGFVFLGVVIWILLNKSTDTLALIIPAIGTVVSELFGLTIFSVYKKSLNQLNSYYDSLHDNERFISLLYITDKLSDPRQRDELFTQIVKDQISTINRQKTKAEEKNAKKPSGKKVVLVKKNKKNNSKNP